MRKIMFRGKALKTGQWIYGDLRVGNGASIPEVGSASSSDMPYGRDFVKVDEGTIGQFTGAVDRNGMDLYEGDIVKQTFCSPFGGIIPLGTYMIKWFCGSFMLVRSLCETDGIPLLNLVMGTDRREPELQNTERLGNIFDNVDLLAEP